MGLVVIDFRKYPFLKHVEDELSRFSGGVTLHDLLTTDNSYLQKAKERIELIRTNSDIEPYQNLRGAVIVFYTEVCLAISSEDELLKVKLIDREAKAIENQLLNEDEETLVEIASLLGVETKAEEFIVRQAKNIVRFRFSTNLNEFLKVLKETKRFEEMHSQGVKIVSERVYLTKEEIVKLLTYKVEDLFYDLIYGDKLGKIKSQCVKTK